MVDLERLKACDREEISTTPLHKPLPVDDYFMTIAILSQELSKDKVSPLHNRKFLYGTKLHKNGALLLIVLCLDYLVQHLNCLHACDMKY